MTIPCYYINLDRSPERDASFRAECARVGIEPTRVAAVDGRTLPDELIAAMGPRTSGEYGVGYGEIGCFLSHVRVWEIVAAQTQDWAFVCEDDIHFASNAANFLQSSDWLPRDADLLKAETVFQRVLMGKEPASLAFGHGLFRLSSVHGGTAGYFVSRWGAEKLLKLTSAACDPVDQLMFNPKLGISGKLAIWQLEPAICVQDYLVTPSDRHSGVESIVNAAPRLFHPDGGRAAKSRGFDRRVLKPLRKLGVVMQRMMINALTAHRFRKVPIEIDGVRFVAAGKVSKP
ncbi:MAG: glycosyltransferase family 25 protein [Hoeflea sp.]|uniref:glycosyltransferase family 25 protein n=1 Tax=Hoeflea sp. TaxID=1940281 RepID=UPI0032980821